MIKENYPLTKKEFLEIYSKVPRLTVEIILKSKQGIYLTKRNIEPCKGMWHLPGGTVQFGEKLTLAVQRIAQKELSIIVTKSQLLGYIEYPSHYENGLDSPVGLAFLIKDYTGKINISNEASESGWFKQLPQNMHTEQIDFIQQNLINTIKK
jgi:ADP-ribose pyrophosphatase YjhB (NUDIX family)